MTEVICGKKNVGIIDWPRKTGGTAESRQQSDLMDLFMRCTSVSAIMRPLMDDVKKAVHATYKHMFTGKSIVDHMMIMMERYAGELETLVQERTQALEEAQKRADRLLYQVETKKKKVYKNYS